MEILIFCIFLLGLLFVGVSARVNNSDSRSSYFLADRNLKWWQVGLSAAITGNTGFIITGAVGIGYTMGVSALLLPLSWLLGDLLYWHLFPQKLNKFSRDSNSLTIPDILTSGLKDSKSYVKVVSSLLIIITIGLYTTVQWVAAGLTFETFFDSSIFLGILISGAIVVTYSTVGGLRSSVRTDALQAFFLVVLIVVLGSSIIQEFNYDFSNLRDRGVQVDDGFFDLRTNYGGSGMLGFILGWAFASLGFGLSQPQVVVRYLAGAPNEIRKAKWLYIIFLQFTWISMTFIGTMLKLIPELAISNPETAVPVYIKENFSPLIVGVLLSGAFSVIASTADSLLLSTANLISGMLPKKRAYQGRNLTIFVGVVTVLASLLLYKTPVITIAIAAVTFLGSCIAPAMIIKLWNINHNSKSLLGAMIGGLSSGLFWKYYLNLGQYVGNDFFTTLTETTVGILVGLLSNLLIIRISQKNN